LFTVAAKEWGLAIGNPIKSISMPKINNARDRRLELDEEERLLSALSDSGAGVRSNPWMHSLVVVAIETAMRQSEILSLKWEDVDVTTGVAKLSDTKNGSARSVPLSKRARVILEGLPRSITGMVFPTSQSAVKQAFARACERAGIDDLHFHDLRHEGTSKMADKLQLHELMKVTGHKDARMLARYYHPRTEDLAKKLG
jgi:integrase